MAHLGLIPSLYSSQGYGFVVFRTETYADGYHRSVSPLARGSMQP